jgi:hypothetical protein
MQKALQPDKGIQEPMHFNNKAPTSKRASWGRLRAAAPCPEPEYLTLDGHLDVLAFNDIFSDDAQPRSPPPDEAPTSAMAALPTPQRPAVRDTTRGNVEAFFKSKRSAIEAEQADPPTTSAASVASTRAADVPPGISPPATSAAPTTPTVATTAPEQINPPATSAAATAPTFATTAPEQINPPAASAAPTAPIVATTAPEPMSLPPGQPDPQSDDDVSIAETLPAPLSPLSYDIEMLCDDDLMDNLIARLSVKQEPAWQLKL